MGSRDSFANRLLNYDNEPMVWYEPRSLYYIKVNAISCSCQCFPRNTWEVYPKTTIADIER